jgi:predicted RNA-binding Zn ribbon-like protein
MEERRAVKDILETSLHGGHLALDFVNTVDWRLAAQRHDLLTDYDVLLHWGRRLGVVSEDELEALSGKARRHPRVARAALERAVELRETLYRIFEATADGATPPSDDLRKLNAAFAEGVAHATFAPAEPGFRWSWEGSRSLERVTWPVTASAVDLLWARQAVSRRGLWLGLPRHEQERQPPLVQHAGMRRAGQDAPAVPAQEDAGWVLSAL